jgi:CheY-like chemotaxis protein
LSALIEVLAQLLTFYGRQMYDLCILDCSMPYFDGFTVISMIRLAEKTGITRRRCRIVVYTAYDETIQGSGLIEDADLDLYCVKGSDEDKMMSQVKEWLPLTV